MQRAMTDASSAHRKRLLDHEAREKELEDENARLKELVSKLNSVMKEMHERMAPKIIKPVQRAPVKLGF